jgi:FkbM family methyltransferase
MSHRLPMKRFRCPNGLRIWSAPRTAGEINFIFREIFEDRCYERHGVAIGDGDVILDLGANVGLFALSAMERFHDLKVVCVEPAPLTWACLERNVAESKWRERHQVTVLPDAIGADNGEAVITYFVSAPGNSTLFPADKRQEWDRIVEGISPTQLKKIHTGLALLPRAFIRLIAKPVRSNVVTHPCKVRTVSDIIAQLGLVRIDLLKIDIEGAELDALRGIADSDWRRIRQIAMEVSPVHASSLDKLIEQLRARGFAKVRTESFTGGVVARDDPMPCMLYALRQPEADESELSRP